MNITDFAKQYTNRIFEGEQKELEKDDPEFVERFYNFAFDEVINQEGVELDDKTRFMVILATLLGCQGLDEFKVMLKPALKVGLTPVEIKEIVYQANAYLGFGRVYPFLIATNEVFKEVGINLPIEGQSTTTINNRQEKGTQVQIDIFGDNMKDFYKSGPIESRHINYFLADNCFGDYYTRTGLNINQREMLTFCYLASLGGCEPQLTSHAMANIKIGNDKKFLIKVITNALPYIGYPRSLNALACVNKAQETIDKQKK